MKAFSRSQYARAAEWNLWPNYDFLRGGSCGVDFPTQFNIWSPAFGAPTSPFILLRSEAQGLYIGVDAPECELVAWHSELRPGFDDSMNRRVPAGDAVAGVERLIRFAAVRVPFIMPGETRTLTPIAMQAYQGDRHFGADIYRAWRSSWMQTAAVPRWAHEPHAWQQTHLNSPEDELRIPFRNLPAIRAECAAHSVAAIQLVGWNYDGQDQGNPSHDIDPLLQPGERLHGRQNHAG